MDKYYVYKHSDKGKIVYIGRGIKGRAWDSERRSNEHKEFIIKCLHENISSIKIIKYFNNRSDACKYEVELINKLKPKFNKSWIGKSQEVLHRLMINNPHRKPVVYMGKEYNSIRECSRITKIPYSSLNYRLKNSVRR